MLACLACLVGTGCATARHAYESAKCPPLEVHGTVIPGWIDCEE